MPDLYTINLHLQERLKREWRDEVRAVEATKWLHRADLLSNRKNGLPLRNLLRAGRVAGQEQRPNQKHGAWWLRRLAESRSPNAILQARERMRRYLPIRRDILPPDWLADESEPDFWQELGKTVAAFGYLEYTLASACRSLLIGAERPTKALDEGDEARLERLQRTTRSQTDSLGGLTLEIDRVLNENGRVPHTVRTDLVKRLDDLRPLRNALCHGAWFGFRKDGSGVLHHYCEYQGIPVAFPSRITMEDLSGIRAKTADIAIMLVEAASVAGAGFALAATMPRQYEPRNTPPERQ